MDELKSPAQMGHNRPPAYDPETHGELAKRTDAFMEVCNKLRADGPLQSEEQAQFLTDHIAGMRGLKKRVEDTRKIEKKPHDDAGKEVLAAFAPLEERLDRAIKAMLLVSNDWLNKKAAEAEAERARKAAEAEAISKAAEEAAAAAAQSGSIDAEIAAENLAEKAAQAEKAANRETKVNVGSATGGGRTISQRTVRKAQINNINALFVRYRANPKLIECLQSLADADVRAKEITEANAAIFGVRIIETKVAA